MSPGWIQARSRKLWRLRNFLILPHGHLFTDLQRPLVPSYALAELEAMARVMEPYLAAAHAIGASREYKLVAIREAAQTIVQGGCSKKAIS